MKHLFFTLILSLIVSLVLSQSNKFGKITNEEWNIKDCNFDSISNSIILFDVGDISIQTKEGFNNRDPQCPLRAEYFTLLFERHLRIKILSDNGLSSDFISINLLSKNNKPDKLTSFQGLLLTKTNEKVEQVKFGPRNLKKITNQDGDSRMVLELSELKVGSIIDINYKIESNVVDELPYWDFRCKYPVAYSEIKYSIPNFYFVSKKCDIIQKLTYNSFNKSVDFGVSYTLPDGWNYYKYSFTENQDEYSIRNVPASIELDEMYRLKYIVSSIAYNSVSFQTKQFVKQ